MAEHNFRLILAGVAEVTPELADTLYEATEGDIEFSMRDGVAYLDFTRSSTTLHDAITAAIAQVESISRGVRVLRVETDAANTIAKINADLLGVA